MIRRWNSFWYATIKQKILDVYRIIFFCALTLFYCYCDFLPENRIFTGSKSFRVFTKWAEVPGVFWMPEGLFRIFTSPFTSVAALTLILLAWKLSLLTSAMGLWTRISLKASAVLGIFVIGLENQFGKTHHGEVALVFTLLIFSFAPCGKSYSVDALRKGSWRGSTDIEVSRWPVQLIRVFLAALYFSAASAKLRYAGLEWVTSDNFRHILFDSSNPVAKALAQNAFLSQLAAGFVVAIEGATPLALFFTPVAMALGPVLIVMHLIIESALRVYFIQHILCLIFWWPHSADENKMGLLPSSTQRLGLGLTSLVFLAWAVFGFSFWPLVPFDMYSGLTTEAQAQYRLYYVDNNKIESPVGVADILPFDMNRLAQGALPRLGQQKLTDAFGFVLQSHPEYLGIRMYSERPVKEVTESSIQVLRIDKTLTAEYFR